MLASLQFEKKYHRYNGDYVMTITTTKGIYGTAVEQMLSQHVKIKLTETNPTLADQMMSKLSFNATRSDNGNLNISFGGKAVYKPSIDIGKEIMRQLENSGIKSQFFPLNTDGELTYNPHLVQGYRIEFSMPDNEASLEKLRSILEAVAIATEPAPAPTIAAPLAEAGRVAGSQEHERE